MNKPIEKFIEEAHEAISDFPALQLHIREDSLPILRGDIVLLDEKGESYDSYSVQIDCIDDYANSFPVVYETKQRLPHNIDWHVYPDGHFCICTKLEEYIHCAKGITLTSFIKSHVVPYLHNQSFREREGYFVNERSHGTRGIMESLCALLKTTDMKNAYKMLHFIYKNAPPKRTATCFCGNGKKYRHCHREAFQLIKSIGQDRLRFIILSLSY